MRDQDELIKELDDRLKQGQLDLYAKERAVHEKETEVLIAKSDAERARAHLQDKQATLDAFRS